jgi:hypothetical protein
VERHEAVRREPSHLGSSPQDDSRAFVALRGVQDADLDEQGRRPLGDDLCRPAGHRRVRRAVVAHQQDVRVEQPPQVADRHPDQQVVVHIGARPVLVPEQTQVGVGEDTRVLELPDPRSVR